MPYYRRVGELPPKRHTQFRQPNGTLYAEELMGQEGFSSDSSLLYHRFLPTAIVAAEEYEPLTWTRTANRPLKPRHFQTHKLDSSGADPILEPTASDGQRRLPHLVRRRRPTVAALPQRHR